MENEIKYFSMFTGVGGFELGLSKTSWEQQRRNEEDSSKFEQEPLASEQFTCIGMSEIDKYASELLKKRFPNIKNYGDATKIKADELPDFDLLCGGFPCQAFSIAGKRRGFQDTRGTMFFEISRILEVKRPKIVLLENVKGLLNHEKGKTFSVILQTLDELGYEVQWMVLNSKFFGVPQNRERVFIIGSLRGEPRPEILPFRESINKIDGENKTSRQIIQVDDIARENKYKFGDRLKEDGATFTLNSIEQRGILEGAGWEKRHENTRRVYGTEGISPTIPTGTGGGVMTKIMDLYNNKEHSDRCPTLKEPHHNTLRVREDMKIRKLTPTECERLQGFPDNWTEGFSDTQRYKMMGNAVTVNVIKAIGSQFP